MATTPAPFAHYACAASHHTGASTYNAVAITHDAYRACADPTAARSYCDIPRVAYPGGADPSRNRLPAVESSHRLRHLYRLRYLVYHRQSSRLLPPPGH